jgi:hypothetical protein
VIISFLLSPSSPFKTQLNSTLNTTTEYVGTMTDRLGGTMGNIQGGV